MRCNNREGHVRVGSTGGHEQRKLRSLKSCFRRMIQTQERVAKDLASRVGMNKGDCGRARADLTRWYQQTRAIRPTSMYGTSIAGILFNSRSTQKGFSSTINKQRSSCPTRVTHLPIYLFHLRVSTFLFFVSPALSLSLSISVCLICLPHCCTSVQSHHVLKEKLVNHTE